MNEQHDPLKDELDYICNALYNGNKNKMILDLLVVSGHMAELELPSVQPRKGREVTL